MKRFGIISGLALAALALTNCAKEVDTTNETLTKKEGVPFEIIAMPTASKTSADGMNTAWVTNDKINLFHAAAGTSVFYSDGEFTVSNTTTGQFSGNITTNIPVEGDPYDWYAIYPYYSGLNQLDNIRYDVAVGTNSFFTLGAEVGEAQAQTGKNSTAHLAGSHMPLYGIKKNATYNGSAPIIQMNQLASVAAITITNKTSAAINISEISFTAPEDIIGTYRFNILGENVVYTKSGNSYVSSTAKLTVTEGTLNKDDVGVFYIAIKPFTAHSGDIISLTVTTDLGDSQTKEFNLSKDYTFSAGKMKTVKMDFTKEHQDLSGTYYQITSVSDITDDGYYMIVMPDVANNRYLAVKAAAGKTGNLALIGSGENTGTIAVEDGIISCSGPAPTLVWGVQSISNEGGINFRYTSGSTWYGIYESSGDINTQGGTTYWIPTLLSSQCFKLTTTSQEDPRILSRGADDTKVKGYQPTYANLNDQVASGTAPTQGSYAWAILKLGAAPTTTPKIMDAAVSDLSPRGSATNTVNVTKKNTESAIKILSYDGTVVTAASISGNTVTFTTANNYTSSARTGTITVALDDDETVTGTITVNQLASEFHLPNNETSAEKQVGAAANSTTTIQVTSDFDWTIDATNLNGATATPASFTYLDTKTQTVTIKSTSANTTSTTKDLGSFKIVRTADNAELTVTVTQKDAKLSAPTVSEVVWSDKPTLKATATWSSVANASSYAYKVEYDNGNSFIAETSAASNSAEFTIASGTLYKIYVKAVGDEINWFDSEWSDPYSFNLSAEEEHDFTWDLTTDSYSSATASLVTWTNANATMTLAKGTSQTDANNYLGGTNAHTRFYKDQILTISPASGVALTKVEITCAGSSYVDEIQNGWNNATTSISGAVVTVIPTTGTSAISVSPTAATRITGVKVYYTGGGSAPITVATPTFNPAGGTYTSTQNVTISCSTTGATIKYTTDNTDPSANYGSTYSSAITIATTTTLKAIAIKDGVSSEVATAQYTISSGGMAHYELVSSITDITEGNFLMVADGKAASSTGKGLSVTAVTISNNSIVSNSTIDAYAITISSVGNNQYSLMMQSNYIGYKSSTDLQTNTSVTSNSYKWTITMQSDGTVLIKNVGTTNRFIGLNEGGTQFKAYSTSNTSQYAQPKLYKYVAQ